MAITDNEVITVNVATVTSKTDPTEVWYIGFDESATEAQARSALWMFVDPTEWDVGELRTVRTHNIKFADAKSGEVKTRWFGPLSAVNKMFEADLS